MSEAESDKPTCCPKCGERLGLNLVAQMRAESQFSFTLHPKEGELLKAETFGQSCIEVAKMMKAFDREDGTKTTVLVERIETTADGGLKINFLIALKVKP